MGDMQRQILCDPQTSGGLLVAVTPEGEEKFLQVAASHGFQLTAIGELVARNFAQSDAPLIQVI